MARVKWKSCHECEHDGKASDACLTCPGPSENFLSHNGSMYCIDAHTVQNGDSAEYLQRGNAPNIRAVNLNTPGAGVDDDETVDAKQVRAILEAVEAMDKRTVLLFHALLKGMGMTEAAEYAGYSRQFSYAAAHNAVDACPALAALLPTRITMQTP